MQRLCRLLTEHLDIQELPCSVIHSSEGDDGRVLKSKILHSGSVPCKIGSLDIFLTKLCVKATEENYTSTRSILLGPINVVPITVAKVAKIASGEIGQRPISSLCHGLCQTRPLMILLNTRVDYALTCITLQHCLWRTFTSNIHHRTQSTSFFLSYLSRLFQGFASRSTRRKPCRDL